MARKLQTAGTPRILFVKPPDRFLQKEFVYQQLGPHYLQSFLEEQGIPSDILILHEPETIRHARLNGDIDVLDLDQLEMLLLTQERIKEEPFDLSLFGQYDIVGQSVMTPQAPDALLLNESLNKHHPHLTTIIGGSHARYYLDQLKELPESLAFDFIVPHDGWEPMRQIAQQEVTKNGSSQVLSHSYSALTSLPAPTRNLELMSKYEFSIGGVPSFHTITALGCPFTCNFCESSSEKVRTFSEDMIRQDLETMATAHKELGKDKFGLMLFDDVGLMNPRQARKLATLVSEAGYTTWRAFTHAYLVVKYQQEHKNFDDRLLTPFVETGGRRIGMGLETGSQRTLDLINKRNGQKQYVQEHIDAVILANKAGVAVDAFTMIYPWETEEDLYETTKMVETITKNPVDGVDELGRPMKNHVDSTIMAPFQGTPFNEKIKRGEIQGVSIKPDLGHGGNLFYKGIQGGSGWPYLETVLPKERYEEEQSIRNAMRPSYR